MRSGNPALKESTFLDLASGTVVNTRDGVMTLNGTVNRTAFLLILTLVGAMYTWNLFFASGGAANLMPYVLVGALGYMIQGGIFMWPILILGIIAVGVMIERWRSLKMSTGRSGRSAWTVRFASRSWPSDL